MISLKYLYGKIKDYDSVVVTGSFALLINEKLDRYPGDIDLIFRDYEEFRQFEKDLTMTGELGYCDDYVDDKGVHYHIIHDSTAKYETIEYLGVVFKCSPVIEIMKYKLKYAVQNIEKRLQKHLTDLQKFLGW